MDTPSIQVGLLLPHPGFNQGSNLDVNSEVALRAEDCEKSLDKLNHGTALMRTQLPHIENLPDLQTGFEPVARHHLRAEWHKWSQKRQEGIAWREIKINGTVALTQTHISTARSRSSDTSQNLDRSQPLADVVLSRHIVFALLWYLAKCGFDSCDSYLGKLVAKHSRDFVLDPVVKCFYRLDSDAQRGFLTSTVHPLLCSQVCILQPWDKVCRYTGQSTFC